MVNLVSDVHVDRLKLRHLRFARDLAELGQLNLAADKLCISQPAASKTLSEIEEIVGTAVFLRNRRIWQPTPVGMKLLAFGRRIIAQYDAFDGEIRAFATGLKGDLIVGIHATSIIDLIAESAHRLKHRYPGITIHLREGLRPSLLTSLRNGTLDLVVGRLDETIVDLHLETVALSDDPMHVVASSDHPALQASGPDWADITSGPWILPPATTVMRHTFAAHLRNLGLEHPANWIEADSVTLVPALLRSGRYLALALKTTALHWNEHWGIGILPLDPVPQNKPVGLIWRKDDLHTPGAIFKQIMLEVHEEQHIPTRSTSAQ